MFDIHLPQLNWQFMKAVGFIPLMCSFKYNLFSMAHPVLVYCLAHKTSLERERKEERKRERRRERKSVEGREGGKREEGRKEERRKGCGKIVTVQPVGS